MRWRQRILQSDFKDFDRIKWANVLSPRRRSLELGPGGIIGVPAKRAYDHYPGADAVSDAHSIDNEDFTGNFTWPNDHGQRYSSADLHVFIGNDRWAPTYPSFSYKKLWYAERAFNTGLYGFHFEGYFYEAILLSYQGVLDYTHLEAPDWLQKAVFGLICVNDLCPSRDIAAIHTHAQGFLTIDNILEALCLCNDSHIIELREWILGGSGYRIARQAWTHEARTGRFTWDRDATEYQQADTPRSMSANSMTSVTFGTERSYTTGGHANEFDRRVAMILGNEKFQLLTTSICVKTRDQYLACWRCWAQYSACMGLSPWINKFEP